MRIFNKSTFIIALLPLMYSHQVFAEHDTNHESLEKTLTFFDRNQDGKISSYEALDVFLSLEQGATETLTVKSLATAITRENAEQRKEIKRLLSELDSNQDNSVTYNELPDFFQASAHKIDLNSDNVISLQEMMKMDSSIILETELSTVDEAVNERFESFDRNNDGFLTQTEVTDANVWERINDNQDVNQDGQVSRAEMTRAETLHSTTAAFTVKGDKAIMSGIIASSTPAEVLKLILNYPNVKTIEMSRVGGSIDDEANLRAADYVRQFGLNTRLTKTSMVASGGTDFFLAGVNRSVEKGAFVGVHSWANEKGQSGDEVPKDDPQHQLYLDYYKKMGIPAAFYWHTMEAAPAHQMYWMKDSELNQYHFRTK